MNFIHGKWTVNNKDNFTTIDKIINRDTLVIEKDFIEELKYHGQPRRSG